MRSTSLRYHVLACASLARAVYAAAATAPAVVTVEVLPQGLHDRPRYLRSELQRRIDAVSAADADAVLLAFGLCGTATAGLVARDVPLVLARAHDCITLHLGSRAAYDAEFRACPGTYWMSRDFLERNTRGDVATLGVSAVGRADLVARFGAENAAFLAEAMQGWVASYERVVWLEGTRDPAELRAQAAGKAREWSLDLQTRPVDHRLVTALVAGEWGGDHLVVAPGERIGIGAPDEVVTAAPAADPAEILPTQKGTS